MLKGQLLPAPQSPQGTLVWKVHLPPTPPHPVDCPPDEAHGGIPQGGNSKECTSDCAKLASRLSAHRSPRFPRAAARLPPPLELGGSARPHKPLFWGPQREQEGKRPRCAQCRTAWRSGQKGCLRWKELGSLQKPDLGGSGTPSLPPRAPLIYCLRLRGAPPPPRRAPVSSALPPYTPSSLQRR